jgi:hypothetical protein
MPRVILGPFSLEVPPDWTLSTVIFAGPLDDNQLPPTRRFGEKSARPFQRNLVATMEQVGAGETPDAYLKRQVEALRKAGVERQEAGARELIKLPNGYEGLLTEQVIAGGTGEYVRQMQLVSIKDSVAYTIIASHLDGEAYESVREEFRNMLFSFL